MKPLASRLIFNADGETWMTKYPPRSLLHRPAGEPLSAAVIQRYVSILADSGIDTLCIHAADRKA